MGQITLLKRIKQAVGHIAWKIFIWAEWNGDELAFHDSRDEDAIRYHESEGNIIRL